MKCPNCGAENEKDTNTCTECGRVLNEISLKNLRGFNFGAFFLNCFWLIAHGKRIWGAVLFLFFYAVPITNLILVLIHGTNELWAMTERVWGWKIFMQLFFRIIPITNLIIAMYLGTKGNTIAWQSRRFGSIQTLRNAQRTWTIRSFEILIPIFIFSFLAAILIPSYIETLVIRDRRGYRECLYAVSSVKTAIEILRTETDITAPKCNVGNTIEDCLAEEIIGMVGNRWANANDLSKRIGRSCKAWGESNWETETAVTIIDTWRYEIKAHTNRGFYNCNICVTEYDYSPQTSSYCIKEDFQATCRHNKSQEMTE